MVYHKYELASNKTSISNVIMQRAYWGSGPLQLSLLSMILLVIFRVEFLYWNWPSYSHFTSEEILKALVIGLRFDLVVTAWLLIPFWLLYFFFPLLWARKVFAITFVFAVLQFPWAFLNTVDMGLYPFTGKRMTAGNFYLFNEVSGRASGMLGPYIVPILLQICMVVGIGYLTLMYAKRRPRFPYPLKWPSHIVKCLIAVLLLGLAARGGWQRKPITFANAQVFSETHLNNLVLNSSFTVLKSIGGKSLKKFNYYSSPDQYREFLNFQPQIPRADWAKDISFVKKPNIVFLIVESLALEYMSVGEKDKGYTPFLNDLAGKSLFFTRGYANGLRSVEGIASMFAGIPALMDEPFISSEFSTIHYKALGKILKERGYETSFFHGAMNGSMYFNTFLPGSGVDKYFGLNEYPNKAQDFDGTWGIFDEPYLQYFAAEVSKMKAPYFASVFTLSSHHPFPIPEKYKAQFEKGPVEIVESIQYADLAVKKYFETAARSPEFENTVFIITGDHTSQNFKDEYNNEIGRYLVPIIIYKKNPPWKPQKLSGVAQHIDLIPTIQDLLDGDQGNSLRLSQSLLRPHQGKHFFAYIEGRYRYADDTYYAFGFDPNEMQVYRLEDTHAANRIADPEIIEVVRKRSTADIQYFTDGLRQQNLYE